MTPRILASIFVMAAVTYLTRMIPLVFLKKKLQNRFLRSFLQYVPYAVLAAMTFPDILSSTSSPVAAAAGLAAAFALAWFGKGLLTVALGGVGAVLLAQLLVGLLA